MLIDNNDNNDTILYISLFDKFIFENKKSKKAGSPQKAS